MSKITSAMAVLGVVAGLGVAALPLSSYAITSTSQPVTIRAEVNNTIAVTSSEELVELGTINGGTPVAEKSTTVTVSGTDGTKFDLKVEDTDAETALVNTTDGTATIPTGTNLATGTAAWGFKVANSTTVGTWTAMGENGAPVTIKSGTLGATADETIVTFGVSAAANQANGTYEDQVVFTAVTTE